MATPPTRSPRAVLGCVFGPTVLAGDALMLGLSGGGGRSFFSIVRFSSQREFSLTPAK